MWKFMIRRHIATAALLLAMNQWAHAEIVIGAAGPLQGQYAAFGEQLRQGVALAVADINATGGVNGEQLVLQMADDGCEPRKAVEAAQALVARGVRFVAGHYCSGSSIPASKIYEAASVLQISPASTNPKLTEDGGWNVHRVVARDDAQGSFAGAFIAHAYNGRRIAILADQTEYGQALASAARSALRQSSVSETMFESYTSGAKEYHDLVLKLQTAAIDVVYLAGAAPEAAYIIREMRELGMAAQLVGPDALVTDEFWSIARDSGEGTIMTFPSDAETFPEAQSLVERFKAQNFEPEGYTLQAYAAVQAYAQAALATGSTDSRKIATWLRAGNPLRTVIGTISLDAKGDVKNPRYTWFRWSAGKYGVDENLNKSVATAR